MLIVMPCEGGNLSLIRIIVSASQGIYNYNKQRLHGSMACNKVSDFYIYHKLFSQTVSLNLRV